MGGTWIGAGGPEGLDGFLALMGQNWAARTMMAQVMKSFTPKMVITCEGDGEKFLVINHTPKGINSTEFLTNGIEFEGLFGPEKFPGKGTATWDGNDLRLHVQMKDETLETTRRLADSGKTLVHITHDARSFIKALLVYLEL